MEEKTCTIHIQKKEGDRNLIYSLQTLNKLHIMFLLFIKGVPFFISHYRKTAMDCNTDSSVIYKMVEKITELKAN